MRKSIFYFSALLLPILLLSSCKKNKDENEALILKVNPSKTFLDVTSGEVIPFSVSGSSPVALKRLKITYKKEGGALQTFADSTLETKNFSGSFPFTVGLYGSQSVYLNIFFELIDSDGNSFTVAKGLNVVFTNRSLNQIVDNELYSRLSGSPSVYNIRGGSSLSYALPYTEDMNISDTLQADSLAKSWISPAGGMFVKLNSFDYTNGTLYTLKNSFEGGAKTNKIANLTIGDIILYRQVYDSEIYYSAMKITDIQNNAGSSNDKYTFDIKH